MSNTTNVKDPFHGVTLEMVINRLVSHYGWERLGKLINIKCFQVNQSVNSSLKFLRKTPWARTKVEELYLRTRFKDELPKKETKDEKTESQI